MQSRMLHVIAVLARLAEGAKGEAPHKRGPRGRRRQRSLARRGAGATAARRLLRWWRRASRASRGVGMQSVPDTLTAKCGWSARWANEPEPNPKLGRAARPAEDFCARSSFRPHGAISPTSLADLRRGIQASALTDPPDGDATTLAQGSTMLS